MILFDRKVELKVYTQRSVISITENDMQFSIEASRRRSPNTGEFTILNLREATRNAIRDAAQYVEFFAGYGNGPPVKIHKGFITFSHSSRSDVDFTTVVRSKDAGQNKEYTNAAFAETFAAGTPVVTVINKIAASMAMPAIIDFVSPAVLLSSETYMGNTRSVLDDVCRDYGLSWSVQFGTLEIVEKGNAPLRDPVAIHLSAKNLLAPPTVTSNGVRIKTLIVPGMIPSRVISVPDVAFSPDEDARKGAAKPKSIMGFYIIDSIQYSGDVRQGAFEAEIDAWNHQ